MERSAVIVADPSTATHLRRLAKESGHYAWERYISVAAGQDWERAGEDWVTQGIEPES